MSASNGLWKPIGRYIKEVVHRVGDDTSISISGVNIQKGFIPTVANMTGVDTSKYKLVLFNHFACNLMHIGRDVTIPIAYNKSSKNVAVSPAYYVFTIQDDMVNEILPQYLEIILTRDEFGRLTWFHTDGSIRGNLPENTFREILIPVPSIEIQRELVATYNGLKALAEQNEALIEPLSKACEAFIVDCKTKYPEVQLGEYIEESNERNVDNEITLTQGVDVNMQFIPAKREAADKESTKIVRKGQFAFNKVVKAGGTKLPIALRKGEDCIISSSYAVFQITKTNELLAEFLFIWMSRKEFHRYCGYVSKGTTRDVFDFDDLSSLKCPLPPIEVQRSIVNVYNCLEEAKKIATEARERLKTLCPALVQRAANS